MEKLLLQDFSDMIMYMSQEMVTKQTEIAAIDAETGDGDLGVTVVLIFRTIKKSLKKISEDDSFSEIFKLFAEDVEENAPSTFGTFFSTMLASISKTVGNANYVDGEIYTAMLKSAAEGVMERGKAKRGDKTLLDALIPAGEAAAGITDLKAAAKAAAEAAVNGAKETESMQAATGRAGYMGERTIGHRDAGAHTIAEILTVFADYCNQ